MEFIITDFENKLMHDVSALKYVDQDWGQMDFFQSPPVKYPCALIDIQTADFSDIGDLVQQGDTRVVIRIFDLPLSNSSGRAPNNQKENARKVWKLIVDINKSLHGQNFLQEGCGLPMRKGMRRIKREDGCIQTELYYQIQSTDASCKPTTKEAVAQPNITVSLKKI